MAICIAFAVNKQVNSSHLAELGTQEVTSRVSCCRQTEFGIVYSCVDDKMFYAQRGRGAFLNQAPLHVSAQEGDLTPPPVTSLPVPPAG